MAKKVNSWGELAKEIQENGLKEIAEDAKKESKKYVKRLSDDLMKEIKTEVDKANKRLSRMGKFQKNFFEAKGITHISRKGGLKEKLEALAKAKIVNESGISTKTEYKKMLKELSNELSMPIKAVEYMFDNFDNRTRSFIEDSKVKLNSNPQIDFLYEDIIELNNLIKDRLDSINIELDYQDNLAQEIIDEVYRNE